MKTRVFLSATVIGLLISSFVYPQTGESKFKLVILNSDEKRVAPLFPSFSINELGFTDANMNLRLDGKESGFIRFYVKNTGTILLQELCINLIMPDSTAGITYDKKQTVKQLNLGDSTLVNFTIAADEKLSDGSLRFEIFITDTHSDSIKIARLEIPARKALMPPVFNWTTPTLAYERTDFSVVNIAGVIRTKSNITGLKIYIDGQVPDDRKSFEVLPTENLNEYRLRRTIILNEGDNEIKIEAKNDEGVTTSETRVINYFVPKIDQTYNERRLALVIGNADYKNSLALQNPLNDAKAMAQALKDVGFTVLLYLNSDLKTMKKAMDEFGEILKAFNIALFYYAGHGMQVKGNNFLVPVDASLKVEQDVDYDCVDSGRLLGKMEAAGTTTNIVILDACRDNPFSRSWSSRSFGQEGKGLAFMNAPSGSIIAYATSPGKTASDGTGKNGIYTEALLKYIKVPGLSIEDFFKNVRIEVETKTNGIQTPWESTSLKGNFFFSIK
jgi:hypothetical protein